MSFPLPTQAATTVLVCAPTEPDAEARVVLADGSYEADGERVFWRHDREAEVLRLPLQAAVSVRPLKHFPEQRNAPDGERRLLAALAPHREPAPAAPAARSEPYGALARRLTRALAEGDVATAEGLAGLLWRHVGLAGVHASVAECLAEAGAAWARGSGTVLRERRLTTSARAVLERLRATSPAPVNAEPVVLAVPEGERHTLALTALAHQLQESGRSTLVVDDLPLEELCSLLRESGARAVVISAHTPIAPASVRRLVATLREASPDALVVLGGPGVPRGVRGPDLVTDDITELVAALEGRGDVLSPREREVVLAVAEGLTNGEIAQQLGVSPATVKTHLDHVFAKTGTEHRAAAVACALRKGWIT